MAHIFALQGAGSCGKSSTLIELLSCIKGKYPTAMVQSSHGGTRDIKTIISPINGWIIGIESQGDPRSRLLQSLTDFANAKCDIIFCACRTSGMTVQWINAMQPQYNVQFIQQRRTQTGQQAANTAMANHLMQVAGI